MFAVDVRDRIMIGHSLPDPFFGPAQAMHGATFVVDVAFADAPAKLPPRLAPDAPGLALLIRYADSSAS